MQHQRVDQSVDDRSYFLRVYAEKLRPSSRWIVTLAVAVRPVGMVRRPISLSTGSISTASTCLAPSRQRRGDVVSRPGADDQNIFKRLAPASRFKR